MSRYTMTMKEAAAFLGMSYPRFTEYINSSANELPFLKLGGRYYFSEIALRQKLGEQIEIEYDEKKEELQWR